MTCDYIEVHPVDFYEVLGILEFKAPVYVLVAWSPSEMNGKLGAEWEFSAWTFSGASFASSSRGVWEYFWRKPRIRSSRELVYVQSGETEPCAMLLATVPLYRGSYQNYLIQ